MPAERTNIRFLREDRTLPGRGLAVRERSRMREQDRLPEKVTTENRREVEFPPAYRENSGGLPEKVFLPKQKLYRPERPIRFAVFRPIGKAKLEPKFRCTA